MAVMVELAPVVKTIEVSRSAADAFRIFTGEIGAWWPIRTRSRAKDSLGEVTRTVTIEPRVGGRVFETLTDGRELEWGAVLAFNPGSELRLAWRMGKPASEETQVTVRFEPLGPARCRVTLTHDGWERMGDDAATMRNAYDNGWVDVFEACFARAVG